MDYQTFKAVVAGNLINEPEQLKFKSGWLTDDPNKEHWKRLAIEGTYPEAIYATNSHLLLSLLIGEGHGKEHYREWATNGNFAVKSALIRHGYCLDLLVSDYDVNIGMCVVQKEPDRIGQLLAVHSWQDICRALSIKKDLPYMLVKTFLEYMPHGPIDSWCALWAEALQLKLEAWQQEQTNAFECTMTREQLYSIGNAMWTQNLRADRIANVLYAEQMLQKKELVLPLFEQLLTKGNLSAAYMITNKVKQKQLDGKE
jgi:hypothetical protein